MAGTATKLSSHGAQAKASGYFPIAKATTSAKEPPPDHTGEDTLPMDVQPSPLRKSHLTAALDPAADTKSAPHEKQTDDNQQEEQM
eukprot:CAMPEP_0203848212 /NCGR_PEP_ID=MMETSP0359-20131031/5464_1 /ASSEMBLY_ACC=CAM_ASM_000338 /TAXON_ID=268821 /ORGANISM="Scrippsiella Hangoei, Strain SHTV-5" /LENGTH=85 /DNA_ID=CAMNT_0050763777 /DNA_START=310 /DNA_END=566 /DNA_ORIENTATION=+